jgi:hypothetical protein
VRERQSGELAGDSYEVYHSPEGRPYRSKKAVEQALGFGVDWPARPAAVKELKVAEEAAAAVVRACFSFDAQHAPLRAASLRVAKLAELKRMAPPPALPLDDDPLPAPAAAPSAAAGATEGSDMMAAFRKQAQPTAASSSSAAVATAAAAAADAAAQEEQRRGAGPLLINPRQRQCAECGKVCGNGGALVSHMKCYHPDLYESGGYGAAVQKGGDGKPANVAVPQAPARATMSKRKLEADEKAAAGHGRNHGGSGEDEAGESESGSGSESDGDDYEDPALDEAERAALARMGEGRWRALVPDMGNNALKLEARALMAERGWMVGEFERRLLGHKKRKSRAERQAEKEREAEKAGAAAGAAGGEADPAGAAAAATADGKADPSKDPSLLDGKRKRRPTSKDIKPAKDKKDKKEKEKLKEHRGLRATNDPNCGAVSLWLKSAGGLPKEKRPLLVRMVLGDTDGAGSDGDGMEHPSEDEESSSEDESEDESGSGEESDPESEPPLADMGAPGVSLRRLLRGLVVENDWTLRQLAEAMFAKTSADELPVVRSSLPGLTGELLTGESEVQSGVL